MWTYKTIPLLWYHTVVSGWVVTKTRSWEMAYMVFVFDMVGGADDVNYSEYSGGDSIYMVEKNVNAFMSG